MMKQEGESVAVFSALKPFLLGSIAACGAVTVTNPFDVVKTRLVLQGQLMDKSAVLLYRGPLHAFASIVRDEGPRALMKGLAPAYATQIFMNGTRLGIYPIIKRRLRQYLPAEVPEFPVCLISGMCAGVGGAALGSPFQLLKTRMQAHSSGSAAAAGKYGNMMTALRTVCREEGVAGLRKAIDTCMLKVAVASAVQLSVYDITKRKMNETPAWQERVGVTGTHIAASVLASFCVVTVINPMEVINTRLYAQSSSSPMYLGAADCLWKTVANEGFGGLYKGWSAHFLRVAPHTVLTFVLLEALKSRFAKPSSSAAVNASPPHRSVADKQ